MNKPVRFYKAVEIANLFFSGAFQGFDVAGPQGELTNVRHIPGFRSLIFQYDRVQVWVHPDSEVVLYD